MKRSLLAALFFTTFFAAGAQTNVRAWYADGQVWVVWEFDLPLPDWYAVHAKPTAFASTANAVFVGKPHKFEYGCAALKEQLDTSATPRIPAPIGLDTSQPFPLSVWLHGGGGTALQSLAGSRPIINIKPVEGILLAHNDDLLGWRDQTPPYPDMPSWHFGWRKNYDPFTPGNLPTGVDTIVNYTQRRLLWTDAWLIKHFNIDPARIHLQGHSMGSAGSTALVKCYPEHYASATIFNNGFGGPDPGSNETVLGEPTLNFPTNLKNRAGQTVHLAHLFNLLDNCAAPRDLPLIRHWHGKNDDDGTMRWDPYVVENYRKADSLGFGVQNMWSERAHGVDTGPAWNDHWVNGNGATEQTAADNVAFAESRFRADRSFPAFFNHRLDAKNNDPGTGLLGFGKKGRRRGKSGCLAAAGRALFFGGF